MTDVDALLGLISLDREHQMRAVRAALQSLLAEGRRGIVFADEVGCGKTFEALATAALLWRAFEGTATPLRRILVVAEPALVTKWFDEIEAPVQAARGFPQYVKSDEWEGFRGMLRGATKLDHRRAAENERGVREGGRLQVPPGKVYIAKPLLLAGRQSADASPLVRWAPQTDWDVLIVDEAHHFARLSAQRSRVFFPEAAPESRAQGLSARFVLALTATPFQLATKELLNLLRIVHADEGDLLTIQGGLVRYEQALAAFYARRCFAPTEEPRARWVDRLHRLRTEDASDGAAAGTAGLQDLLRRYLLRNVRGTGSRRYSIVERRADAYPCVAFDKLDDLRPLVARSPLVPLQGNDAWAYLQLRDVLVDAQQAARESGDARPSFVSGDLRQGLSSYEQLAASALLQKPLNRAASLKATLSRLQGLRHPHPKVAAMCRVVDAVLEEEIARVRRSPGLTLQKVLIFNTLMRTAGTLKDALEDVVARRIQPFVEEDLAAAGIPDITTGRDLVREALRRERVEARERLLDRFRPEYLVLDRAFLDEADIESRHETRDLVDVMFARAENHAVQPLFLLRLAGWLRARGEPPTPENVQDFVMNRIGGRLTEAISRIVDDFLDDTPLHGEAGSPENRDRAARELQRLKRILAAPDYVARFDGEANGDDRDQRRENFNRPYAPLVLLVSRVGEEGIDLQQHTRWILHYDVEWNPGKMEQREGRVDREGRRGSGPVDVRFFLLKDTYEERVFHTVMQRDAWFQLLIGSKRQELAKGIDSEDETPEAIDLTEDTGHLTADERDRVMIDLRP